MDRLSYKKALIVIIRIAVDDLAHEIFEILGFAEVFIDRGEAHIGDGIEIGQAVHDEFADHARRDVAFARAFQPTHDAVDHALDALGFDGALAQRQIEGAGQLIAVEGRACAALFHHRQFAQLDALEGRETRAACRAKAPPPDGRVVLGRPGILYLGVVMSAERATHRLPPIK